MCALGRWEVISRGVVVSKIRMGSARVILEIPVMSFLGV